MNESADESDLLCFKRPASVLEYQRLEPLANTSLTKYDFAAIQDTYYLIPGSSVRFDLQEFCACQLDNFAYESHVD
jgi:hypothetical protein